MKNKHFKELLQGKKKVTQAFHFRAIKIKEVRANLGLTQDDFARMICVSVATVRNWEQGRTYPGGAAIALLRVAEAEPQAVLVALHNLNEEEKDILNKVENGEWTVEKISKADQDRYKAIAKITLRKNNNRKG